MKKTLIFALLLMLVVFNYSAFAQDGDEIEKDKFEVTFFGGFGLPNGDLPNWSDSLGAASRYAVGFDFGFFVTYNIVAGFNFNYYSFDVDSPDHPLSDTLSHRLYNPNLYMKYYLSTDGNFVPYVKGAIGLDFAKFWTSVDNLDGSRYRQVSYDPALSYGIGAGFFYYTHDYAGFFIEGNYHVGGLTDVEYEYGSQMGTFGSDLTILDIHAGIRVLVGSDE